MSSSTATSTPVDEVDALISEVSDEHGLKLMDDLTSAPTGAVAAPGKYHHNIRILQYFSLATSIIVYSCQSVY